MSRRRRKKGRGRAVAIAAVTALLLLVASVLWNVRRRVKVTFPEGFTRFDMAKRLEEKHVVPAADFLRATEDPALLRELAIPAKSAEGYLFPATYTFVEGTDAADIVRRMKAETDARIETIRARKGELLGPPAKQIGFSIHDVVTIASMVEKETTADDERPIVASVFYNRFVDPTFTPKPPRLQSDPTTAYGCIAMRDAIPSCASFSANKITPEMNADAANPYSTYAHAGLPPGPIANPGEKSLEAAFSPAATTFLYFVAKGGGRHTFSSTMKEHDAAVKALRDARHGP